MPTSSLGKKFNRRSFIAAAGAAALFPTIVPARALGLNGQVRPSNKITLGVIGWGMQGPSNTNAFLGLPDCQVVAACDLDTSHLASAVKTINDHYQNHDCRAYADYQELLARTDLDAVMLAVPDHWHALIATAAANGKKDIYGEKPLAKTIFEQQLIVRAVQKNNIIWQTGSFQRSTANFHKAAEIVRNGMIGTVSRVEIGLPGNNHDFAGTAKETEITDPPAELDYETWIGPSQMMPYIKARVHRNWRWNYNTGGGQLLDWVGHHGDIAHWALDFDQSGPLDVMGQGEFPAKNAVWNTCPHYRVELNYPRKISMTMAGGYPDIKKGVKWIGTDGWVWVDRGEFDASNKEWRDFKTLPEELRKIKLYQSTNHQKNFIECVKSRQPTITPVETAHHSTIPGHLGLISMKLGRRIYWDNATEQIADDTEATRLMTRAYRAGYRLPTGRQLPAVRSPS